MIQLTIYVKTGSHLAPLVEAEANGDLTVYVQEQPQKANVNAAVIRLLAAHFDVPNSKIEIIRGLDSQTKQVRIRD